MCQQYRHKRDRKMKKPLFAGLIIDENDQVVETAYVGEEPCYIVDDSGFKRHIPSVDVDRQILNMMVEQIRGNEELYMEQTTKMLGQDDLFTRAIIQNQLKNIDKQMDTLLETGLPEEGRAYMGMMGFKIVIDIHGEIIRLEQPGRIIDDE